MKVLCYEYRDLFDTSRIAFILADRFALQSDVLPGQGWHLRDDDAHVDNFTSGRLRREGVVFGRLVSPRTAAGRRCD